APPPAAEAAASSQGLFGRLRRTFSEALSAAEADRTRRASGEPVDEPASSWGRLKRRGPAGSAGAIAEQRFLWQLRKQGSARLHYPSDIPAERATEIMRASLTR